MKTIQSIARYFPDPCGGIQIHLSELVPVLRANGIESQVTAAHRFQELIYHHNGIEVHRYPVVTAPKPEPNHGHLPPRALEGFLRWLQRQDAALYHQHQWTPECGLPHLKAAKELGLATVVTIHLPVPICQRNTLMFQGQEACDGQINWVRCSRCCGVPGQLPTAAIQLLGRLPIPVSQVARGLLRRSPSLPASLRGMAETLLTPFSIPRFVAARQDSLREMVRWSDRIIAVSQWLYDALLLNGVPPEKLVLCRCGVSGDLKKSSARAALPDKRLKVGFLGRWNANKGIHILVEAMQQLPAEAAIDLVLYSIEDDPVYRQRLLARIGNDPRIQIAPPLTRDQVAPALAKLDVLAVPSQWLETGPLVVLEAHACGLPVLGSHLGGIAELVQHRVNGLLLPPRDPQAWATALLQLSDDPGLLHQLRRGIRPVRSIGTEAMELAALYRHLVHTATRRSHPIEVCG